MGALLVTSKANRLANLTMPRRPDGGSFGSWNLTNARSRWPLSYTAEASRASWRPHIAAITSL
jgi:hypothetical protein